MSLIIFLLVHIALNGDSHPYYWFTSFLHCSPPFVHSMYWRSWRPLGYVSPSLHHSWPQFVGLLHLPGHAESWRPLSGSELGPPCSESPPLLDWETSPFHHHGAFHPSSSLEYRGQRITRGDMEMEKITWNNTQKCWFFKELCLYTPSSVLSSRFKTSAISMDTSSGSWDEYDWIHCTCGESDTDHTWLQFTSSGLLEDGTQCWCDILTHLVGGH